MSLTKRTLEGPSREDEGPPAPCHRCARESAATCTLCLRPVCLHHLFIREMNPECRGGCEGGGES